MILAEWHLIRAHGGSVWTAEALRRIQLAKARGQDSQAPRGTGTVTGAPAAAGAPRAIAPLPSAPTKAIESAAPSGKYLYTAINEYLAGIEADAKAGQISTGRWVNISYA